METKVDHLNETNYRSWSLRMKGILTAKACWSIVANGLPAEPTPNQLSLNERAIGILMTSVDEDALEDIASCITAKEIWDTLKTSRGSCDSWQAMTAFNEYASGKKLSQESIIQYWRKKMNLLYKIQESGMPMSDFQAGLHIAMGLPKEHETFVRSMKTNDAEFDIRVFKRTLLEEENKLQSASRSVDEDTRAFSALNRRENSVPQEPRRQMRPQFAPREMRNDYHREVIPVGRGLPHTERGRMEYLGYYQRSRGLHLEYRGSRGRSSSGTSRGRFEQQGPPTCYRCGNVGHIGRNCPRYGDQFSQARGGENNQWRAHDGMQPRRREHQRQDLPENDRRREARTAQQDGAVAWMAR